MKKIKFNLEKDGMYATYYPTNGSKYAFIALTGDDTNDLLAKITAKWLHKQGINVLAMSPNKKDYSHHSLPIERFEKAIKYLKEVGNTKIGIIGMSTTAMVSLIVASYLEDISLVVAISPSDFVMEGFYQDNGIERPGDNESTMSYKGEDLPFIPMAYRYPEYEQKLKEEAKLGKNMMASRKMFDLSEELHPLTEETRIKIENIKGTILFIGAEDDCLWNTCKYIKRMQNVLLNAMKKGANARFLTYEHGTHFLLPESLMKMFHLPTWLLPAICFKDGRIFKKECKESRIDVDKNIKDAIKIWKEITLVSDCKKKRISTFDEERFKDTVLKRTKNL